MIVSGRWWWVYTSSTGNASSAHWWRRSSHPGSQGNQEGFHIPCMVRSTDFEDTIWTLRRSHSGSCRRLRSRRRADCNTAWLEDIFLSQRFPMKVRTHWMSAGSADSVPVFCRWSICTSHSTWRSAANRRRPAPPARHDCLQGLYCTSDASLYSV